MQQQITKFVKWQPKTSQEELALKLIRQLHQAKFIHTYIVGGYVRDMLLKRPDTGAIDIATEATPEQVTELLQKKGYRVIPTGIKHGTVTVHKGDDDIEFTTFRKEGKYVDWRRPASVSFIRDPRVDSSRRDFTVNALYFDPLKNQIFDFQGGIADLQKKILRFVGSPVKRISEDALRLMRAVRFSATLRLKLTSADKKKIKRYSKLLIKISPERIKQELDKVLLSPYRPEGIKLLHDAGLLAVIMPEVEKMSRTGQSKNYHSEGNVFVHTLLALSLVQDSADLKTLYGLLFHDLGKTVTAKKITRHGRPHVTFYGHQQMGEEIAEKIMERLRFSNAEINDIKWYVLNHHVPYELSKMRKSKQTAWCLDPRFENLLKLYRADSLASIPTDKKGIKMLPSLESYNHSLKVFKSVQAQPILRENLVSGHDVMNVLKLKPGPKIGKVLEKIKNLQLSGKLSSNKEALAYLKKYKKVL